ncbi:hypothetical protein PR202_gb16139 [Eleusine coracana subsp. coracana]|uniref:Alpha/beta hydrolase fold-3 domain-containing protein n=1 Tax=Eleusine coracana subsp. coracana TaxID=191504 RepID=A0AAV5F050_ELECO|nr:hypothetical protein PR202_gb16125 [Eleusine coracana subsp. coracana]GJN28058.1 hypothetical protein PR202_gb16139 [Eleusine coracana subsp. coracana]
MFVSTFRSRPLIRLRIGAVRSSSTSTAAGSASPVPHGRSTTTSTRLSQRSSKLLASSPSTFPRLPAAIDAGHDALLWLRDVACGKSSEHAAPVERLRAGADFSRVFLIGDSSGGNLVHLVAARAGEDSRPGTLLHPVRLAGGILLHPGFAREQKSRSEVENPPSLFLTPEMIDKLLALGLPLGATKDSPYTSPELAANAVAHLRMPPMLLMVAEKDLLHDPQVDYGKAMVNEGKAVKTVVSRGNVAHIFYLNFFAVKSDNLTEERTTELVQTVRSFIDQH